MYIVIGKLLMRSALVHSIKSVRKVPTRIGPRCIAVLELAGQPQCELWMSIKQGDKLSKCFEELQEYGGYSSKRAECHVVMEDGDRGPRFVWCGMHSASNSELPFLEEKFGVTCAPAYTVVPDASERDAHALLRDE